MAKGVDTPIGILPAKHELNLDGLDIPTGVVDELLRVDVEAWQEELRAIGLYLDGFGARMPERLKAERLKVSKALDAAVTRPRASVA
jgi:phosphoenolpyruvate carboxykinase (GTP)